MPDEENKHEELADNAERLDAKSMRDAGILADPMDELLHNRIVQASELPWVALNVENQLAARAKARSWLQAHRSSLKSELLSWIRSPSLNPRLLAALGAGLGAGALAYLVGQLPFAAQFISQVGIWPLVILTSSVGALAVSWPTVKHFYL